MGNDLIKILDDCIEQVKKGDTIDACLDKYPAMRERLEPLLRTAISISSIPKVQPTKEFIRISNTRLLRNIQQDSYQDKIKKSDQWSLSPQGLSWRFRYSWQSFLLK